MHTSIWPWLKWASLIISVGSIVVAILLMWLDSPQDIATQNNQTEKPQTRVEAPVIVERKDGNMIWQLRALEANQQLDGQMNLVSPTLTLFTKSGDKVIINSKQAWFDPLQRDVRFQDDVIVDYEQWQLTTDTLSYISVTDVLHIPGTFSIKGGTVSARGRNMRLHRGSEQINVDEGIWIEDKNPQWQGE